jgi:hypothetical protein
MSYIYAYGERQLSISFEMVMGKPHDDIFGHPCLYLQMYTMHSKENSAVIDNFAFRRSE